MSGCSALFSVRSSTGDDMKNIFDLYSHHAEFEKAQKALEDAWEEAKLMQLADAMAHMRKVQNLYVHVGAGDTEPREIINEMISEHFDVYIPWWLA